MADITDVEDAISGAVTFALYPNGSAQGSLLGLLCRVYRGWPSPATLNADLSTGAVNITVNSDNDSGRTTTRYLPQWQTQATPAGVTVAVSGQTLIISGVPRIGDAVGVIIDRAPYVYRVQQGDSVDLVAAGLSRTILRDRIANYQGSTITVPGASAIAARAVCDNRAAVESRRQEKDVRVVCWCPTPSVRDTLSSTIDAVLSAMVFVALPDGTQARVTYRNTQSYDQSQNALLYRRDLVYTVEYATIELADLPSMLFGASGLSENTTYI